jgi:hypothetical protein
LPDSPRMRQTAAPRSSLDALDQWGIQFPLLPDDLAELVQPTPSSLAQAISSWRLSIPTLLPRQGDALDQWGIQFPLLHEDLAELVQPTPSSLAQAISSWRLSIPTLRPRHGDALDQWGIEFPIIYDELAAFGANCRGGRSQARISAILGGRLNGFSRFGAYAAIVAVVVAGSASAVPSPASAGALPTRNEPVLIVVADSAQIASLSSITEQPSATSNPTPGPTPGATLSATEQPSATSNPIPGPTPSATLPAEALGIKPVSNIPAPAVLAARPVQVGLIALPTIQDARDYLVARLGAGVDRRWGLSQSKCASLIFQYEAHWDPHATNKSSGAYGLPQAHPASKLANWAEAKAKAAVEAGDPDSAWLYRAWRDNPVVQAEWGVDYMTRRYGSPCGALAFRSGYWQGGVLIPGRGWY